MTHAVLSVIILCCCSAILGFVGGLCVGVESQKALEKARREDLPER